MNLYCTRWTHPSSRNTNVQLLMYSPHIHPHIARCNNETLSWHWEVSTELMCSIQDVLQVFKAVFQPSVCLFYIKWDHVKALITMSGFPTWLYSAWTWRDHLHYHKTIKAATNDCLTIKFLICLLRYCKMPTFSFLVCAPNRNLKIFINCHVNKVNKQTFRNLENR